MWYDLGEQSSAHIPVTVEAESKIRFRYGTILPELKMGTIGVLVVPISAVVDETLRSLLQSGTTEEIQPDSATLFAEINPSSMRSLELQTKKDHVKKMKKGNFVEILMLAPLTLRMRGTKRPELLDCSCRIPALAENEGHAFSVNHAYTLISQTFEPHRRSHSGNVFTKVFYMDAGILHPLDDLRQKAENLYVEKLRACNAFLQP